VHDHDLARQNGNHQHRNDGEGISKEIDHGGLEGTVS
jgi:hypothetical protein